MKRALVVGMGGLRGGYDAGVVVELCRELGPDYFDTVFASSVGVFAATFFLANQPDIIENTWRNLVDGRKLVNLFNFFRHRDILDLEYLTEIFQNEVSRLNTEQVFKTRANLIYVLTEYPTGKVVYCKPKKENLFELMRASSALPFVHRPIRVDGVNYIDGGLVSPLPIAEAIKEDFNEIIAVYNKPSGFYVGKSFKIFHRIMSLFLPPAISKLLNRYESKTRKLQELISQNQHVTVIRQKTQIPLRSILDTNKARLNATIDKGVSDAQDFLKSRRESKR